jgi:hypothetical protein
MDGGARRDRFTPNAVGKKRMASPTTPPVT